MLETIDIILIMITACMPVMVIYLLGREYRIVEIEKEKMEILSQKWANVVIEDRNINKNIAHNINGDKKWVALE